MKRQRHNIKFLKTLSPVNCCLSLIKCRPFRMGCLPIQGVQLKSRKNPVNRVAILLPSTSAGGGGGGRVRSDDKESPAEASRRPRSASLALNSIHGWTST